MGLLLACTLQARAQSAAPAPAPAGEAGPPKGITIDIRHSPASATVGDPISFNLEIGLPAGVSVEIPKLEERHGDFTILEVHPNLATLPGETPPSPKSGPAPVLRRHRARIVAAAYRTGDATLPPIQLKFRDGAGKESAGTTMPVHVRIESVLGPNDAALIDLKRQAEIEDPVRWTLWLAALLLALATGLGAWTLWRRRKPAAGPRHTPHDPLQLAETELRDLLGRGLLESGMVKPFYVALSEIARRLIEAGHGIPAMERTTGEILDSLRDLPPAQASRPEIDTIGQILHQSDFVKFAKSVPTPSENQAAIDAALSLLGECRRRRQAQLPTPAAGGEAV